MLMNELLSKDRKTWFCGCPVYYRNRGYFENNNLDHKIKYDRINLKKEYYCRKAAKTYKINYNYVR